MKIKGTHYRSLWWNHDDDVLEIIDHRDNYLSGHGKDVAAS